MYNLRYHIASLIAVFLSLAVGLLLGTVVVERGVLDQQKTTLVEGLTKDFEEMKSSNNDMRSQLDRTAAFSQQAVAPMVGGALADRVVAVFTDPARGETFSRVTETVRLAGGTPMVITVQNKGFGLSDPEVKAKVIAVIGETKDADLEAKVASTLAQELMVPPASRPLMQALADSGQLTLEGSTETMTVSAAVLTGSFSGKPDPANVAVLKALQSQGRPAVGVEVAAKTTGVAAACTAAQCSAVDHIDEPVGQVSLVWLLAGRASGYFGVGPGATGAFPTPLFPGG